MINDLKKRQRMKECEWFNGRKDGIYWDYHDGKKFCHNHLSGYPCERCERSQKQYESEKGMRMENRINYRINNLITNLDDIKRQTVKDFDLKNMPQYSLITIGVIEFVISEIKKALNDEIENQ